MRDALRRAAERRHDAAMQLYRPEVAGLMDGCEHRARTQLPDYPEPICWRCAGWPKVTGRPGRRIRRRLRQARALAYLGGVR